MTLPALLGGPPIRPQGPPDWPPPDDAVSEALQAAYRDGSWGKDAGGLVPMPDVMELATAAGVGVIEDAAQAVGAVVNGRPAGSWGDVGVLSFGGSKLLTAGRGGAILTRRRDTHQRARVALHRGNIV